MLLCRQRARQLAAAFGFERQEQTRIATAVSEIVRNAFEYAGGGRIEFAVETSRGAAGRAGTSERQSLVISVHDGGPGLSPDGKKSENGLGAGLAGAERLMDALEISSRPGATTVTLRKAFPPTAKFLSAPQLQAAVDRLAAEKPVNPLAEVQFQNQELIRALEEVQVQREDIAKVNRELADTNTGVLALYDELETLHRVSILLASKLDLKTLLQAIIDATTDLTSAQFGAFFYRDEKDGSWRLHATAGPARAVLAELPTNFDPGLFGEDFLVQARGNPSGNEWRAILGEQSKLAEMLGPGFPLRSCLMVPVAGEGQTLGAMVFGSEEPGVFTERSERIVSSIAAQAVVGIEKARLFERVQSASAAKDRFLAMLSHELRTPLNPVLAVVSNLVGDPRLPHEVQQDLDVVLRNVRLEARLIDDLLDFSRIINGKLQLHREPVDLHALIRNVVNICAEEVAAGAHTLTLALDAPQTMVFGDAARLQQILWNLLKNAVKFTPASGRISIQTALREKTQIEVTIADNGVGIEAPTLARIFDAFEQGDPETTARFGGLGLGLAITKAFVELHGGTIRAASAGFSRGTQMTFRLPLFQQVHDALPATISTVPTAVASPPAGTLLLVDDHADTLSVMSRLLTRRGYRVVTAISCHTAVEAAAQNHFDLIVSDLGLPDGSGLTLLARLRRERDVPAIALSGYGMEEDVRQSRAAGYNEHLTKPIDFSLLMLTVNRLLSAPKG